MHRLARPAVACSLALSSLLLLLLLVPAAQARLQLAQSLGSHMVLQREPHRAAIYGCVCWLSVEEQSGEEAGSTGGRESCKGPTLAPAVRG